MENENVPLIDSGAKKKTLFDDEMATKQDEQVDTAPLYSSEVPQL